MVNNRGGSIDFNSSLFYNKDMEEVQLLSVEQTAKILGISRSAAYSYLNSGRLKAIKLDARTMVKLTDLTDFIESRDKYTGSVNEV